MRCAYHPDYFVPLPPSHPFPMAKYPLLFQRLRASGWLYDAQVLEPGEAALGDLRLVHTEGYLQQLADGTHHAFPGHGEGFCVLNDVGLADGTGDDDYLALLRRHLDDILARFEPDIVFYLAGVDPVRGDRYGRLSLSDEGLRQRERCVLDACVSRGLPTVITIAGGYAPTPERTAELHSIVFEEAVRLPRRPPACAAS